MQRISCDIGVNGGLEMMDGNSSIILRTALHDDVVGIQEFSLSLDRPSGSESFLHACVDDPERRILLVLDGERIIGWAKTHHYPHADAEAPAGHYLGGVSVHPDYYRRGVGTAMTRDRLAWIWERDATAFYVTNSRNTGSLALHQRLGFIELNRAERIHGLEFDGGVGVLFQAQRPELIPWQRQ